MRLLQTPTGRTDAAACAVFRSVPRAASHRPLQRRRDAQRVAAVITVRIVSFATISDRFVDASKTACIRKQISVPPARREDLSRRFCRDIMDPASCLHSLLPPPRSTAITSRLRSSQILPEACTCTKRYCSFIQYGLNHYQYGSKPTFLPWSLFDYYLSYYKLFYMITWSHEACLVILQLSFIFYVLLTVCVVVFFSVTFHWSIQLYSCQSV